MKKGPLGTAEKFYIEQKWNEQSIDSLATELHRAQALVEKHVIYCKKNGIGIKLDRQTEAKAGTTTDIFNAASQMGVHKGTVVMTENASTLADTIKISSRGQAARPSCITKIKNESE